MPQAPLGIVIGEGDLPRQLTAYMATQNRSFHLFAFNRAALKGLSQHPHHCLSIGKIGRFIETVGGLGISELVFAGKIMRPSFSFLSLDDKGRQVMRGLMALPYRGDDAMIRYIHQLLESEGLRILPLHQVYPAIIVPEGCVTAEAFGPEDESDIALAIRVAAVNGRLDVGQAVVVRDGEVIGVEAAEGTDALLLRTQTIAKQRGWSSKAGVLVKICKPEQDERSDLPAIGTRTVEHVAKAQLRGIVLHAGKAIIIHRDEVMALADRRQCIIDARPMPTDVTISLS